MSDRVRRNTHHIRNAQEQAAVELAAQRRSVMGVNAVLATNPLVAPTTPRPVGDLNPTLAAGGVNDVLANAKPLQTLCVAYRAAWEEFKATACATFPGGTLLMRTRFRQACTALDASWCMTAT
jgi:hypothetical protein